MQFDKTTQTNSSGFVCDIVVAKGCRSALPVADLIRSKLRCLMDGGIKVEVTSNK